ncbi:hypothetical protein SAY86_012593 [Trapa natans]|uniref:Target of Myb protein 1-like n=1 Tax=Trapa natans TaxID=22666 RepID=A0AAN7R7B6_TRANT|nr:hypothetical protein SAY86_012593 [Trapa natans]
MMMMMPPSSVTVRVDKATSDLLMNPDWAMNLDICDYINSYPGHAREFVKAVKRRLQHRSPKVQFLALTLLETMVKNCGDYIHFQIAEKNIPAEMVKIVKKKADIRVRDKVLLLLDAWKEAFGGPGGKHPQYYYAYEELRRSGIQFPFPSRDTAPIFTPPVTRPTLMHMQPGYGMPSNSSRRLDEAMAQEIEGFSMSTIDSMRDVMNLLSDMLQVVNPRDSNAVKDEVIVDLVARCQSNQRRLMQMLTTTGDEELLVRGLELNDNMQTVLAKHDAIASGSPLPTQITNHSPQLAERLGPNTKEKELKKENDISPRDNVSSPSAPPFTIKRNFYDEEDEEEDDFAQLARRHSKSQATSTGPSIGGTAGPWPVKTDGCPSSSHATPSTCRDLVLSEPPMPVKTSKEQDMIDLLSLALTTTSTSSPETPQPPPTTQNEGAMSSDPFASQSDPRGVQGQHSYSSYVVPWAQPQPQTRPQQPAQAQIQPQQLRPQNPPYFPQQVQHQRPQSLQQRYIPPPWASTPGYLNSGSTNNIFWTPRSETGGFSIPFQETRPLQHLNSFPARGMNGPTIPSVDQGNVNPAGQKTFIPSYRLFEDLNVLGKTGTSSGLSGSSGQRMIGGKQ